MTGVRGRNGSDIDTVYAKAAVIALAGLAFVLDPAEVGLATGGAFEALVAALVLALVALVPADAGWRRLVALLALALGATGTLTLVHLPGIAGDAPPGLLVVVAGFWLAAWHLIASIAGIEQGSGEGERMRAVLVPVLLGLWALYVWEMAVVGFDVPRVLLPAPSMIAERFSGSFDILRADFEQTVIKSAATGYAIGCTSGFLLALIVGRIPYLKRGLIPFARLVPVLPLVAMAPVMALWLGSGWPMTAAVVAVMTFFPMLVSTLAGLDAAGRLEHELMRTYSATRRQMFLKLRLPAAMPLILGALKVNTVLALVGAIVGEFLGAPVAGMGYRILAELGRMNIDMVWAEIVAAALIGSLLYGLFTLIERGVTFWHPARGS